MATLDQLAEEIPQPVTVVKLDVEGAEFRALQGAQQAARARAARFHRRVRTREHLQRQGASAAAVQELFEAAEYIAYRIGARSTRLEGEWMRPEGDPNILRSSSRAQ